MTQDHDDLDYDAWVAPPAPDVTDAVIARARVPMSTATETVDAKRSTRTLLLAGGAIALSVAAIVIAVMIDRSKQPPPAPSLADLRVEELEKKVDELEAAITKLNAIGSDPAPDPTPPPDPTPTPPTPPTPSTPEPSDPGRTPAACDVAALTRQGNNQFSRSQWSAALAAFEAAFACKQTKESALLAALAACRTGRAEKAKEYFALVDEQKRPPIQQVCLMKGIELGVQADEPTASEPSSTACNWDALQDEGKRYYGKSLWGAALQTFEQAYACRADPQSALLAGASACKAGKAADAKRWYERADDSKRPSIRQMCLQKGIEL